MRMKNKVPVLINYPAKNSLGYLKDILFSLNAYKQDRDEFIISYGHVLLKVTQKLNETT